MSKTYYAHSTPPNFSRENLHPLFEHLGSVSKLSQQFASIMSPYDLPFIESARMAGLFHDLGKYGDLFQRRLQGKEKHIDHWAAGTFKAAIDYKSFYASLAILGHHIGLQCISDTNDLNNCCNPQKIQHYHPLNLKLSETDYDILKKRFQSDFPNSDISPLSQCNFPLDSKYQLDLRMLYSCLVDADFLDTEAHFQRDEDGKRFRKSGLSLNPELAWETLRNYLTELRHQSESSSCIQEIRDDLWDSCVNKAESLTNTWTLSAPTGSGKTLSMLAFALRHAIKNRLQRIIIVIPFLTIIEQTAQIYRKIFDPVFGDDYVLEDHSLSGTGCEKSTEDYQNNRYKLLSENWDAPIVITTHVQLLQSLFSNRSSACRKLHNIAQSVILFDEIQTLPPNVVLPTLSTLSHLSKKYNSSIVFSTATQPAFDHLDSLLEEYGKDTHWIPQEIAPQDINLFSRSKRTIVQWPEQGYAISWENLALELLNHKNVLCIVNIKRHAHDLIEELKTLTASGIFHLSTTMCPVHRERVLEKVKARLKNGEECRLISTQCVEAGVDIDFPVVYRALGPLEAIAQAAGRCNRNGLHEAGKVVVFLPENDDGVLYPPGGYEQAASVTQILLNEKGSEGMDIDNPLLFEEYYKTLYDLTQPGKMNSELKAAIGCGDFPEIARLYQIINQDTVNVLVPYQQEIINFNRLRDQAEAHGLSASWIRRARPLTVNLFRKKSDQYPYLIPITSKFKEQTDWYYYSEKEHYDDLLGLSPQELDIYQI